MKASAGTIAPTRLVARTEAIDAPDDLLDALGPDGCAWLPDDGAGFVTDGVAAVVEVESVDAFLGAISCEGPRVHAASGPIAVGALRFDGEGRLVVPARVVGRDPAGRGWRTTIGRPDGPAPLPRLHAADVPARSHRYSVEAVQDRDWWDAAVRAALAEIASGEVEKVVLAREVVVESDAPFPAKDVLARLRAAQPGCTVYGVPGFVGASPELLVRRRGRTVESRPMAGTAPRGGSEADDTAVAARLLASAKDRHEHRLVVDAVVDALRGSCERVVAEAPEAVRLATVTHLATRVSATLRAGAPSALALARALHPTPAVGGAPRDAAVRLLERLEPFARGPYAAPVGWVAADGDGELVVGLRGAELAGRRARLLAGAGIVAGSDPAAEWAETQAKLEPMLRALVRP